MWICPIGAFMGGKRQGLFADPVGQKAGPSLPFQGRACLDRGWPRALLQPDGIPRGRAVRPTRPAARRNRCGSDRRRAPTRSDRACLRQLRTSPLHLPSLLGANSGISGSRHRFIRLHSRVTGRTSALLDGPVLRVCARVSSGTDACEISYDADGSAGRRNDRDSLARDSGRSANAVPGTAATAQRGLKGLDRGDERTAIGAVRSIVSCLVSRGGDSQVRK
jgi:hypothetical protein